MDYATGKVGERVMVSWHAITEWLYVEPHSGMSNTGSVSRDQVKRMAGHLVRAGLVEMRSNGAQRHLIFQCLLADRLSIARKQPARNPPDQPAREPARRAQSENTPQPARQSDRAQDQQPAQHPVLSSTSTTTPGTPCEVLTTGARAPETILSLVYPRGLTTTQLRFCSERLSDIDPGRAQELLDEFAGALNGTPIRHPISYFRAIVQRFEAGEFTPEKGLSVRDLREESARVDAELERRAAEANERSARVAPWRPGQKLSDALKQQQQEGRR